MRNQMLAAAIKMQFDRQLTFAEKVGLSELHVSQVITGRRKLSREEQARWAQVLQTPLRLLFPEENSNE
jgi:transcriptional regulator with XRE-family HTH domain